MVSGVNDLLVTMLVHVDAVSCSLAMSRTAQAPVPRIGGLDRAGDLTISIRQPRPVRFPGLAGIRTDRP